MAQLEYGQLLDREGSSEQDFQSFFEDHPCFMPEAYGTFGRGGHGPYPGAIVSQPILPGITTRFPDFLYIARDSATVFAVMIEIEHPRKLWATKSGRSTAEFTQATDQILEWKAWFSNPLNVALFRETYRIPEDWTRLRTFEQRYMLVYGRGAEESLNGEFNRKRSHLQRPDEIYMTFDRLRPNYNLHHCVCARIDASGYRAISVPPTIELGPNQEYGFQAIRDKVTAVKKNKYISDTRKEFLCSRIPYWDNWSGSGVRSSADFE
ncbi:Shedu anti-phage system protein SduA domain-containing protein [Verrucomicrobium sp. BvORR106]|uniref:Shedu anti-phage system protein SduA domain-containing protein n=1 Tax=Verrucomicrobium sp. BvORR106 TaxID=1403819 RepID=UPI002240EC74|nr:Shedu anti-phage system protein SduA domain-containing protein [Verrucomicrobium sp. BvORR106]